MSEWGYIMTRNNLIITIVAVGIILYLVVKFIFPLASPKEEAEE